MKLVALLLSLFVLMPLPVQARVFKQALPGYKLQFPADHRSHNEFKTEWWYYTGHLQGEAGTRYGYELTFFRTGMDLPKAAVKTDWKLDNIYLAHFAISDISGKKFFHTERINRAAANLAGADQKTLKVWNADWSVKLEPNGQTKLIARSPDYNLDLTLSSDKPPILHGQQGLSQKASCVGCASHYYSLTRLRTEGTLNGKKVTGITWMDHEFGSNQLTDQQVGWDWFSLQLDDKTELMLYVMRRKDGTLESTSSGTYVLADGTAKHLALKDYKIDIKRRWKSPHSGGNYPSLWKVTIPSLGAQFDIEPELEDQELVKSRESDVTYWEGSCRVSGNIKGRPITGQAYVEMTGYAEIFNKRI